MRVENLSAATLTLAPNTTYWVGLTGTGESNGFFFTTSTSYTSSDGWTLPSPGNFEYYYPGGSWQTYGDTLLMQVNAKVVPEPSSWALLVLEARCCWVCTALGTWRDSVRVSVVSAIST